MQFEILFYTIKFLQDKGRAGGFGGLTFSEKDEIEHLFSNAVEEAISQLPQDGPGVLIVETPLRLTLEEVAKIIVARTKLKEDPERVRHLSAILFVFTYFIDRTYYDINFVQNPEANIDVSSYAAIKAILSLNGSKENL